MTDRPLSDPYRPELLPAAVRRYLRAHQVDRDTDAAAATFAADARVVDERREHVGSGAIRDWLATAGQGFTYTTTFVGQLSEGPGRCTVLARLEGDFPGGVADLRFRFRVESDRIAELVIAP